MATIEGLTDKIRGQINEGVTLIKTRLFGSNNERLDFIVDSFYKLSNEQRIGVIAGLIAGLALFLIVSFLIYFSFVGSLRDELSDSFAALHEMQDLKLELENENKKFERLRDIVQRKAGEVKIKPFFEKLSKTLNVKVEGITEQKVPLPADNPLSTQFQEIKVDMRLQNISIPRMLNFLVEIEKAEHFLRIQDLQIRERYGTRLYFDIQAQVRGYSVGE